MSTTLHMKKVTVYKVEGDSDCEGRGPRRTVGYYASRTIADKEANGQGAMGSMGYVTGVRAIELTTDDNVVTYYLDIPIKVNTISPRELKEAALKKVQSILTDEELAILNIKE